jgi:hypothetical protein
VQMTRRASLGLLTATGEPLFLAAVANPAAS